MDGYSHMKVIDQFRYLGALQKCSALVGCCILALTGLPIAQSNANELRHEKRTMSTRDTGRVGDSADCVAQIMTFVHELDKLLASNPQTIHPVKDLLRRYFPVEACDIQEVIKVARRSRFFSHVSEEVTYFAIVFDSKGFAGLLDPGIHVQVNLLKASGDSWLPSANINKL
jgi:hypothetical protein